MTNKIDMSSRYTHRALMISEEMIEEIQREHMTGGIKIEDRSAETQQMWVEVRNGDRKPYEMIASGVAKFNVNGALYHKIDWAGHSYTGYDWIRKMAAFAKDDPEVKGVVIDYQTGGGQVDGAFETAADIRALAEVKPVLGLAGNHAYSAGYLLLSASTKVNVAPTGGVGSIGVVTSHMDLSEAMSAAGYKITFMFKGKHKVDGNPYEPLPKAVQKRIDEKLDTPYNLFVDAVANYRSIDSQIVRDTEAATLTANEALDLGLVDTVATSDDAIAAFVAELNGKNWSKTMSGSNATTDQTTTTAAVTGNENANVVDHQKAVTAAREEGMQTGATTERARIMGILKSDEAKGREGMALVLCDQGMSVEASKAILASVPAVTTTAETSAKPNHFANAMSSTANPELTNTGADTSAAELSPAKKALSALSAMTGESFDVKK